MTNALKHVTSTLNNSKKRVSAIFMAAFFMVYAAIASAAPAADTETVNAVKDGMTGIQLTALAVVAAVAVVAVTLFAAPFAWQYGKKVFKTVAR